jgi:hypothetical protein
MLKSHVPDKSSPQGSSNEIFRRTRTTRNQWKILVRKQVSQCLGLALSGISFSISPLMAGEKGKTTHDKPATSTNATIQLDPQVSVQVNGGVVEITDGGRKKTFRAQFKHNDVWISPGIPSEPAKSLQTAETNEVTLRYKILGNRGFLLKVATLKGTPGAIVSGALENQGKSPVMEHYFWEWSSTSPDIVTPTGKRSANPKQTSLYDPTPWKFMLEGKGDAGWALSTDCVVGRGPTTSTSAQGYLYPLERFQPIAPGKSYTASFAAAWVRDAKSAEGFAENTKRLLSNKGDNLEAEIDYGKPAPDWARTPSAGGYYRPSTPAGAKQWAGPSGEVVDFWSDEVIQKQLKPWPWVVGSQPGPEILKRMQAAGIPLLYYVIFYELLDTKEEIKSGNKIYPEWYESLLHEERDLSNHPDWTNIDESGKRRRAKFGLDNNRPGLFNTCFHQKGLMESIEKQIRALMELGYKGIFVDVAEIPPECHGPKFGIHKHAETDKTNFDKYMEALDLIYRVVKEYGPDRIVVLNEPRLDSHWQRADSLMWENCIYDHTDQGQLQSKAELIAYGKKYAKAVEAGKVLFTLSYAGKKNPWQRSIYTYCYSQLFGFTWSDWNEMYQADPEKAVRLYSLRLGKPLAEATEMEGGVWRRDFPRAIVLWNGDETPTSVSLAAPGKTELRNFADASVLTGKDGVFNLTLPAHSGMILQEIEK